MHCSTPGLPVHHHLPEFTQTHIESVMPSSHLILCHPLLLLPPIPPSIRVFSNESTLRMRSASREEKGSTEDEMAGWHHWLDGCESEWTLGVGDGQGGLACYDSWGRKESNMTERLIWSDYMIYYIAKKILQETKLVFILNFSEWFPNLSLNPILTSPSVFKLFPKLMQGIQLFILTLHILYQGSTIFRVEYY